MRITQIAVDKLFGAFNHIIPLNRETDITIVIGENGLGKTVMLEATNAFFGKSYSFFRELEFDKFTFTFSTDECWEITKHGGSKSSPLALHVERKFLTEEARQLAEREERPKKDSKPKSKPVKPPAYARIPLTNLEKKESHQTLEELSWAKRRAMEHFMFRGDLSRRDFEMVQWMFDDRYEVFLNRQQSEADALPIWFANHKLDVRLIETQRIITAKERGGESYVSTVQKCADELIKLIATAEAAASDIAVALDSTYPSRLVQSLRDRRPDNAIDLSELNNRLQKLNYKRQLFASAGLIETTNTDDFGLQINDYPNSSQQSDLIYPLKLYVEDSDQKLSPYEDLAKRINLFMEIVNKRFKHKNLEVNRKQGFVFRSRFKRDEQGGYSSISPKKLSSGEQNELILFYELIFKSNSGDMILIDEPELSLHISWQNKFIKDLKDVTSMNNVSIIIATHSPDIIDENWDLKVELQGLE